MRDSSLFTLPSSLSSKSTPPPCASRRPREASPPPLCLAPSASPLNTSRLAQVEHCSTFVIAAFCFGLSLSFKSLHKSMTAPLAFTDNTQLSLQQGPLLSPTTLSCRFSKAPISHQQHSVVALDCPCDFSMAPASLLSRRDVPWTERILSVLSVRSVFEIN